MRRLSVERMVDVRLREVLDADLPILVGQQSTDAVAALTKLRLKPDLPGPEVSFWLGKEQWGRGIATAALAAFLGIVAQRPLYGRCATDNAGSRRVLEKCGFVLKSESAGFAPARGEEVPELLFELA